MSKAVLRLHTIISGGQTGADIGGLKAAKVLGLKTGGLMPHGFRTEKGAQPSYRTTYGLRELGDVGTLAQQYKKRNEQNVLSADATVVFGMSSSPTRGSQLTLNYCRQHGKPCIYIDLSDSTQPTAFTAFIQQYDPKVLNVSGTRESKARGIAQTVENFLLQTLGTSSSKQPTKEKVMSKSTTPPPPSLPPGFGSSSSSSSQGSQKAKGSTSFEKTMRKLPLEQWNGYITQQLALGLIDQREATRLRKIAEKARSKAASKKAPRSRQKTVKVGGSGGDTGYQRKDIVLTPKFANAIVQGLKQISAIEKNRKARAKDIS